MGNLGWGNREYPKIREKNEYEYKISYRSNKTFTLSSSKL